MVVRNRHCASFGSRPSVETYVAESSNEAETKSFGETSTVLVLFRKTPCDAAQAKNDATVRKGLLRGVCGSLHRKPLEARLYEFGSGSPLEGHAVLALMSDHASLEYFAQETKLRKLVQKSQPHRQPSGSFSMRRSMSAAGFASRDGVKFFDWQPFRRSEASRFVGSAPPGTSEAVSGGPCTSPGFFSPAETLLLVLWRAHVSRYEHEDEDNNMQDENKGNSANEEPLWLELARTEHWPALRLAQRLGTVESICALHGNEYKMLRKREYQAPLFRSSPSRREHVGGIRQLFGPYCGLYFVFCDELAQYVVPPAIIGSVIAVMNHSATEDIAAFLDMYICPCFALFIAMWGTFFTEHWKRHSAIFAHESGLKGTDGLDAGMVAPAEFFFTTRGIFNAEDVDMVAQMAEDGLNAPQPRESSMRYLLTVSVMLLVILVASIVIVMLLWISDVVENLTDNVFVANSPVILYLVVVEYCEKHYKTVAVWLTQKERHLVFTEHVKSLTIKNAVFQLVNNLGWFVYLALWKQDIAYLRSQLFLFLTLKQGIPIVTDIILPRIQLQRRIVTEDPSTPKSKPRVVTTYRVRSDGGLELEEENAANKEDCMADKIQEQLSRPPAALSKEYQDHVIVSACCLFFAGIMPSTAVLCLIHTLYKRYGDCYKFARVARRLMPTAEDSIVFDCWVVVFEALSICGVTMTCVLIYLSRPSLGLAHVMVLEHMILFAKFFLSQAIPDRPEWLMREEIVREEAKKSKSMSTMFTNEIDAGSS